MAMENKQKDTQTKDRIGWGVRVPSVSFQQAIEIAKALCTVGGIDGSLDALSQVIGNTRSSSSFSSKLSALKNFSLITTIDKDSYSFTELGRKIAIPTSPSEEGNSIAESLMKVEIIKAIYDKYKGKMLPQKKYLANEIGNLGIPSSITNVWADYFVEAANYSGLLLARSDGSYQVMSSTITQTNPEQSTSQKEEQREKVNNKQGQNQEDKWNQQPSLDGFLESSKWGTLYQPKLSGNRKAIFAIPDELTQEDIDRIKSLLKGVEMGLEGFKKYDTE
jgi:hypothetical protein